MPELPEVETIKSQLNKKIKGKKIKNIEIKLKRLIQGISIANFQKILKKAAIQNVERRAKVLIINLSNNFSLLIHLKLTGQLIYHSNCQHNNLDKYTHLIYYFTDGSCLLHNDLRQFGYVKLMATDKIETHLEQKEKFGPEPLSKKFTPEIFQTLLKRRASAKIKQFLMDQTIIAGIGNIYSDEILFYAGLRPTRPAGSLKTEEIKKVYQGIKKILPEAIRQGGTSTDTYIDINGQKGRFAVQLKVYGQENQPCRRCRGKITRLKIAGRSAHFCPNCQK